VSLLGAAAVGVTVGVVAHRRADTARVVAAVPAKALQPRVGESDPAERSAPVPLVQNAVIDPSALPLIPTSVQGGAASSARRASHSAANTDVAASLLEQMALIDRARASLRAGDASHALQSVTEYRRKYPGGNFAPEALFLQMQASKQLGQATLATQAARELVERYPNAPNVSRARDLLQSQTSTQNP
jgi:TolA-binding protein